MSRGSTHNGHHARIERQMQLAITGHAKTGLAHQMNCGCFCATLVEGDAFLALEKPLTYRKRRKERITLSKVWP
jgi:hypothetical protein